MDDKTRGLYIKYKVERVDGKSIDDCIVLELEDPCAREGIIAFAAAVRIKGYFALADDLEKKVQEYFRPEEVLRMWYTASEHIELMQRKENQFNAQMAAMQKIMAHVRAVMINVEPPFAAVKIVVKSLNDWNEVEEGRKLLDRLEAAEHLCGMTAKMYDYQPSIYGSDWKNAVEGWRKAKGES
jgi:hypothetical protein